MMKALVIVFLILILANSCHYSCNTCTNSLYTGCLSCNSSFQLTVLLDPSMVPSQYWSSFYPSGTCLDTISNGTNILGVLLFIFVVTACLVIRTKESFYLLLTLQTYGLYNLVEIAWVNPINYVLQGLQYFMIFNFMNQGSKMQDYILISTGNYRLDSFLKQTSIGPNIAIIAAFTLISFILLIVICILAVKKKKQAQQQRKDIVFEAMLNPSETQKNNLETNQSKLTEQDGKLCRCWKWFSEEALIPLAKLLICILYLMIQQTVLVLLVSLVFVAPVNSNIIALCIIYLHILVFVMSYAYYYRVEYFKQKKVMYINFAKKVILPVMVVVPINNQYLFFLFAGVILIVQFVIDYYNGLYKQINRLAVYKVSQILSVILLITYEMTEVFAKSYSSSRADAIACVFVLALNIFFFCVQVPIGIKQRFFSAKDNVNVNQNLIDAPKSIQGDYTLQNLQHKNQKATIQVMQIQEDNNMGSSSDEDNKVQSARVDNAQIQQPVIVKQNESNNNNRNDNFLKKQQEDNQVTQPQPPKKKRRKQILDKQLRLRYGI